MDSNNSVMRNIELSTETQDMITSYLRKTQSSMDLQHEFKTFISDLPYTRRIEVQNSILQEKLYTNKMISQTLKKLNRFKRRRERRLS